MLSQQVHTVGPPYRYGTSVVFAVLYLKAANHFMFTKPTMYIWSIWKTGASALTIYLHFIQVERLICASLYTTSTASQGLFFFLPPGAIAFLSLTCLPSAASASLCPYPPLLCLAHLLHPLLLHVLPDPLS